MWRWRQGGLWFQVCKVIEEEAIAAAILIQQDREVAIAFQAHATPCAVLVRPDGIIGSPLVCSAEPIRALAAQAVGLPVLKSLPVATVAENGHTLPMAAIPKQKWCHYCSGTRPACSGFYLAGSKWQDGQPLRDCALLCLTSPPQLENARLRWGGER